MKTLIVISLALVLGASLIWLADFEPGFVLLQYGSWSLETSLIIFMVFFLLLLIVGYMLMRSWVLVRQAPKKISQWRENKNHKKASQALSKGLLIFEEGRWADAERILVRHASNSDTPLLHYLGAARAAQKQHERDRRDNYLRLADETTTGADVAVGVVRTELQLEAGQQEQALATLQNLREIAPKHPYVLQLLQQLYADMNQWQAVQDVLPDLRKRRVFPAEKVQELSSDAAVGQLKGSRDSQDWSQFEAIWQQAPNKLKETAPMLTAYVLGLIQQGETQQASGMIETFMRKQWSDELAYYYGQIQQGEPLKRLAIAEKWLQERPNNPWLLLTLGRLSAANKLWAKAEEYLRSSIDNGSRAETYQALADVLLAEDKKEAAAEMYKQGLAATLSQDQTTE